MLRKITMNKKEKNTVRDIAFVAAAITNVFFNNILALEKEYKKTFEKITDLSIQFYNEHKESGFFNADNRFSPAQVLEKWTMAEITKLRNTPVIREYGSTQEN